MITDELEAELSVDEMMGVVKYIMQRDSKECHEYLEQLVEWHDEGYGEVMVASCRKTLL